MVQAWAETLGRGLISAASLLNPEQIVFGGPLTVLFPYVKDSLIAMLRDKMPRQGERGFFSNPNSVTLSTKVSKVEHGFLRSPIKLGLPIIKSKASLAHARCILPFSVFRHPIRKHIVLTLSSNNTRVNECLYKVFIVDRFRVAVIV